MGRRMADKFMYIPNDDTQNYPFCRLQLVIKILKDTQLKKWTNHNSIKFPKVGEPTNKKTVI